MLQKSAIQEPIYIRPLPFGHTQTIAFAYVKELIDDQGKPASTTFHRTVEIVSFGEIEGKSKYCLTCLHAYFTDIRQPDPSRRLQLLLSEVFDLLVVSTDKTGKIIQIHNFGYLQQVWNVHRIEILQDHDDEAYRMYISDMDTLMQNQESIISYLLLPSNYGLYFNGYKNFNLKEPIHHVRSVYEEDLSSISMEEKLHIQLITTDTQQHVTLQIKGSEVPQHLSCTGSCMYLDGQLDVCFKEIKTECFTINYSATWIGLKKSFIQ
ncbi:hypothetical protein [Cytophaga hutchinsonii]|uniref:Uncharacterized protein n=1 Tax=Cytophaga hutchinsonii (strain ATCC 33406 / DSM 1761 / CIP 103989 / NBRC 15051 / NCIMB 9469 / D465) TaxID=269798 RepID=A0A6N4SNY9_CYTH3|nr:hypothetical protein [Cytophaga hutchinsonii]ABG57999.1 hypothetical protein CHU_0712 [Cytophaga hutchinsonii ATCC 33406]SFX11077.1 hypothetical protein SAMN04487930_101552 [Cytophaga hutchinsonii ATCC 33406]